jgi:hypothetical protein
LWFMSKFLSVLFRKAQHKVPNAGKSLAVQRWQRQGVTRCFSSFFWREYFFCKDSTFFKNFFHFFSSFF